MATLYIHHSETPSFTNQPLYNPYGSYGLLCREGRPDERINIHAAIALSHKGKQCYGQTRLHGGHLASSYEIDE